jgi:hypothetical protein
MSGASLGVASAEIPTSRQRLFVRYLLAVLIDLLVLNLFVEHWQHVVVDSFSVSLLVAILLQILLRLTLAVEGRVATVFAGRSGGAWKAARYFSAWLVLFGSKFLMLGAVDLLFGDAVAFSGPLHGVVAFIAVVVVMLLAEELAVRIYRRLE